ncbi:SHOCT domain-containing protein [Sporomusa sp.]|uniref:SHOCT domain-containing protein n=1 Tax=Sporomusa sp. TaxID=2078658 RepID=UPI002C3BDCB4|nr:SHOCT domain-containing protein [Sporomusa sp.]HWR42824.1 SHOCT domain-containing protein [Sporomusa sp.]
MGCDFGGTVGWFGIGLGLITDIAFIALVIFGVVWALKHLSRHGEGFSSNKPTALELLKQRYAKGELSREEYQRMKTELV